MLGHSVEDISTIADCTPAAAKSALQRGRAALRALASTPGPVREPVFSEADRRKVSAYVQQFQNGDFDAIRASLAQDVKLDLVNRPTLAGRDNISPYFTRYAQAEKWRFALGAVEGRPAMLVFDKYGASDTPSHVALIAWRGGHIATIRDFLFAAYALDGMDWMRLD